MYCICIIKEALKSKNPCEYFAEYFISEFSDSTLNNEL